MTHLPNYGTLGIIDRVSCEVPNYHTIFGNFQLTRKLPHTWQQWVCFAFDVFQRVRQRFTIGCEIEQKRGGANI